MSKNFLLYVAPLLLLSSPIRADDTLAEYSVESYDRSTVGKITIKLETSSGAIHTSTTSIQSKLRTKVGDPFSQYTFDQDLKSLSKTYDRVEPTIEKRDGKIYITLSLWEKPTIRYIKWSGNKKVRSSKLQKVLDIKPYTIFDRARFNESINKVREYYIKKGFFESQVSYRIVPLPENNEVEIDIIVDEGHTGHISDIHFNGLDKKDQSAILQMINSKKYNFFTSWLTGSGKYHDEVIEHDKLVITNYLQNQGYADARVSINVHESKEGRLIITISAIKGEKYSFGDISFEGNILYNEYDIQKELPIKPGSTYSPEALTDSVEAIKDVYGKDGYIDVDVRYALTPHSGEPVYNVNYTIVEGHQYKIGLIRVLGNVNTKSNVILRESLLVPGELFDSRKLKATQQRLMATGYFKSVNVYPVKTEDDMSLGEQYRDVIIEVDEAPTGNISLFFGLSTADSVFGGVDFTENNFNYKGLWGWWKNGLSSLRGAGEFASAKISIGRKQQDYTVKWITPYLADTLWRFGFDLNYSYNGLISDDYDTRTMGGSMFTSYPLSQFITYGMRFRLNNAIIDVDNDIVGANIDERNSGLIFGYSNTLSYDSTDNPFKPHRGARSALEAEIAGLRRHSSAERTFPFLKLGFINSLYYPVWRLGTLKFRADAKFTYPFGDGQPELLPFNERYYLGGDQSLRGYRPYSIGPKLIQKNVDENGVVTYKETNDPTGGISSVYFSAEYLQELHRLVDVFVFFDAGSIALDSFTLHKLNMSYGAGIRLDIGNRVPLTIGYGIPINPDSDDDIRNFFFAMGAQF